MSGRHVEQPRRAAKGEQQTPPRQEADAQSASAAQVEPCDAMETHADACVEPAGARRPLGQDVHVAEAPPAEYELAAHFVQTPEPR